MAEARIGISGWSYPPWRGTFYPLGLPQHQELFFACRELSSIEINGSFYSLQRPSTYQHWYDQAPEGFKYSVKGGRFITHIKMLNDFEVPLANFLASGVLLLKEKLGPILWQFPPRMKFDARKFERFLEYLPKTTAEASSIARGHDSKVEGRAYTETDEDRPLRHAFEIRNETFRSVEFVRLLRSYGAALVFADSAGLWPYMEDLTSDFVYLRLHGESELYASGYDDAALSRWAERIRTWMRGRQCGDAIRVDRQSAKARSRDAFVYFDNDAKVHAPFDAMALQRRVDPSFVPEIRLDRHPGKPRVMPLRKKAA